MEKAELTINVIIMAVLGLIVLVILIIVFRNQIGTAAKNYFNLGDNAMQQAQGDTCVTLVTETSRKCATSCEAGWLEVYPHGTEPWKDCKGNKCCEKTIIGT